MGINRQKVEGLLRAANIKEPPVNVHKIALLMDFRVMPWGGFSDDFGGGVFVYEGAKIIAVNDKHPSNRQRFNIAHEIGHIANGHNISDTDLKRFSDGEFNYLNANHRQEKEANMFAAELLMPKKFLDNSLPLSGLDYNRLALEYEVSEQAMRVRLNTTGLARKFGV